MGAVRICGWIVAAGCAAGCTFTRGDAIVDGEPEPDAPPDAPPDVAMGSAAATLDGGSVPNATTVDCGGGGGGGGAGWILLRGTPTITSTIVSPPQTAVP